MDEQNAYSATPSETLQRVQEDRQAYVSPPYIVSQNLNAKMEV